MYCRDCGHRLSEDSKFCSDCGKIRTDSPKRFGVESSTKISDGSRPGPSWRQETVPSWGMENNYPNIASHTPNTPNSAQSIVTTSKYTPRSYDFWQRNGTRAPPPMKKSRSSKKNQKLMKTFLVSQFVGTPETNATLDPKDQIEVIIPIKVDLQKLEEYNSDFSVNDIQREIGFELSTIEKMVILYNEGYPVKDSANTRGLAAWDNKIKFRAVNMESLKKFRNTSYQLIKYDYNEFSDSEEAAVVSNDDEKPTVVSNDDEKPTVVCNDDDNSTAVFNGKDKEQVKSKGEMSSLLNSVNSKFDEFIKTSKSERNLKEKIKRVFECSLCYVPRPNCFYCCPNCGRYLGCFHCIKRLSTCPFCRGPFTHQVKAFFIPGIEEIIDIPPYIPEAPEVPVNIMESNESNNDQSSDSDTQE